MIYSVEADEETIEAEYGLVGQVVNSDEAEVQSRLPASKSLGKEPPNLVATHDRSCRSPKENPDRMGPGLGKYITCPVTTKLSLAPPFKSMLLRDSQS